MAQVIARVATTQFVKTASTWWGNSTHRSAKWISTDEPNLVLTTLVAMTVISGSKEKCNLR
jgi:hypothetical protein